MDSTITTPPLIRKRPAVVAVAGAIVLALGAYVGVGALVDRTGTTATPRPAGARDIATATPLPCVSDMANLMAALATLPGPSAYVVVRGLSPDLSGGIGSLFGSIDASALPPALDAATLGHVLARLERHDRDVIMLSLPLEQRSVVATEEARASLDLGTGRATCP